jgi:hypothetical protein
VFACTTPEKKPPPLVDPVVPGLVTGLNIETKISSNTIA